MFVLFACPTTEHSLPLSIERKNCSWDHWGGRKKEDCVPRRRLERGRAAAYFFGIFFGIFWSRVWQSAGAVGRAIWVHGISKNRVVATRRAHRTDEGWGGLRPPVWWLVTLAVSAQT